MPDDMLCIYLLHSENCSADSYMKTTRSVTYKSPLLTSIFLIHTYIVLLNIQVDIFKYQYNLHGVSEMQ